jgi:alpha-galactosidase/6-phospho-beta-glucosidase family protein
MNAICSNIAATIGYAKTIMADVDDALMTEQPLGMNHPAWILLHLATAADYAAKLLGGDGVCPSDWNEKADTKKPLSENRADYPAKEVLVATLEAAYKNASELYAKMTPESLQAPQKLGFFETELPTVDDMSTFLLVSHANLHLGQLSAWRRATGKGPLF